MNYFIISLIFISSLANAHDHGSGNASVGKGKGVETYDEHDGFVLAKEAVRRLGIIDADLGHQSTCNFKTAEVVSSLDRKLIYVMRKGAFKSVEANCKSLISGDRVVIKGAEFLRVIEIDLQSSEASEEHEEHEEREDKEQHHD